MNHSYLASLLENYRRRMEMDTSALSIRKALYNSYQNESFKLKERQRQAMAKQRREQMESERNFRNRVKEIKAKEREIGKRYQHFRIPVIENVKNQTTLFPESRVSGWPNERALNWQHQSCEPSRETSLINEPHFHSEVYSTCIHVGKESSTLKVTSDMKESTEELLTLPAISASGWSTEQREDRAPRKPTMNESFVMESTSGLGSIRKRNTEMKSTPPSPINSNFRNDLINYYIHGKSLTKSGHSRQTPTGKKTSVSSCTLKFGKQTKHTGQRMSLPDYDILVIDHGEEDNV